MLQPVLFCPLLLLVLLPGVPVELVLLLEGRTPLPHTQGPSC